MTDNFEQDLGNIGMTRIADAKTNAPPEYRIVQITEQLCEAMIESARHQVTRAQENLSETEHRADELRAEAKRRWEDHEAYLRSIEDLGHVVLKASDKIRKANGRQ